MKIAMWSGPRNLSTALMYSFAARDDCTVWDEPFYASYLLATGLDHPMRDQIIAQHDSDAQHIGAACLLDQGRAIFYQKHMCQHMVDGLPLDWMDEVCNVFLIRDPARVLASFSQKYNAGGLDDIGIVQQVALFDRVADRQGSAPIVIDSSAIRANPDRMLRRLCDSIGIPFQPAMLRWAAGPKPYDGVWAKHWYDGVHASTGFAGPDGPIPHLCAESDAVLRQAMPYYQRLSRHALCAQ